MLTMVIGGNLGADPEIRTTSGGKELAEFRVAVSGYDFSAREKTTTWVKVTMWGERATKLAGMLSKGDKVMAAGIGRLEEYETRDGEKRVNLCLTASELTPMGGKREQGDEPRRTQSNKGKSSSKPAPAAQQDFPDDDDVPF